MAVEYDGPGAYADRVARRNLSHEEAKNIAKGLRQSRGGSYFITKMPKR